LSDLDAPGDAPPLSPFTPPVAFFQEDPRPAQGSPRSATTPLRTFVQPLFYLNNGDPHRLLSGEAQKKTMPWNFFVPYFWGSWSAFESARPLPPPPPSWGGALKRSLVSRTAHRHVSREQGCF